MAASKWIALCAIAGIGLASSPAAAAPGRSPSNAKARLTAQDDDEPVRIEPAQPAPANEPAEPVAPSESKENAESLAVGAPKSEDEASVDGGKLTVRPYLLVSGGVKADVVENKPGEDKNNRVSTFALGRLGLRARWLDFVYAESEFMASGGVGLHGTSAYEGQAAMQVRQQLVRLSKSGFRFEVGRLIDEASVDFFSAHVAETFLQDTAVRDPLLFSGFNLGNGIRASYEIVPGLRAALTFNAGNPVSNTASLMIGGAYPPFERFYTQPYQQVNQSANHFPDDSFHSMVVTPSILVDSKFVDVRVAVQGFDVNANTGSSKDDHIRGYNVRGTAKVKLFDGLVVPFASSAYTRNDTLLATDLSKRAPDRYQAVNLGGGVDLDIQRRFRCSHDCADGLGAQYQQVQYQIGEGLVTTQRYLNVGATYWLAPNVSLSARFAMWMQEAEQAITAEAALAGQRKPDTVTNGERSIIAALRFIMP
ncbi:MAG: hypothetical protein K0S65_2052 [Labilithrix sp.]|nr:hypothetical protein [Labilithrix sp.]